MFKNKGFAVMVPVALVGLVGAGFLMVNLSFIRVRSHAADAVIQGNMSQMRLAAEMFYNDNQTYVGADEESVFKSSLADAEEQSGSACTVNLGKDTFCIECPLVNGGFWCLDGEGFMHEVAVSACDAVNYDCQ